jgi:hypothetical protein
VFQLLILASVEPAIVQGEELFVDELSIALEYKKPLTRGFAGGYWC